MPGKTTVKLKQAKDRVIQQGHPWVFSGAIEKITGKAALGEIVEVISFNGEWLARGILEPEASLSVRIYTRNQEEEIDGALFANRIEAALQLRDTVMTDPATSGYRVFFSEADGISGLIVDRFGDTLAVQVGAAVLEPYLEGILKTLSKRCSKVVVQAEAKSTVNKEISRFTTSEETSPSFTEHGFHFKSDLTQGQKTGFFLDQRENRQRVAAYAKDRRVLSAFCYTGAFEVYAAAAGATSIEGIDSSQPALDRAKEHHLANPSTVPTEYIKGEVGQVLRKHRDAAKVYDLIILDPPRFVTHRAQMAKGLRAYKDINLWALKLLSPGGILATFSCSGQVTSSVLADTIKWAANDTSRDIQILESLGQPADHPVLPSFIESSYLKGFIVYAR